MTFAARSDVPDMGDPDEDDDFGDEDSEDDEGEDDDPDEDEEEEEGGWRVAPPSAIVRWTRTDPVRGARSVR
jgi:hypothetical protein